MDNPNENPKDMAAEKEKILNYLEGQLRLMRDRLRSFETPIDPETIKDIRKMEELILKKQVWMLEDQIEVIKMM